MRDLEDGGRGHMRVDSNHYLAKAGRGSFLSFSVVPYKTPKP